LTQGADLRHRRAAAAAAAADADADFDELDPEHVAVR